VTLQVDPRSSWPLASAGASRRAWAALALVALLLLIAACACKKDPSAAVSAPISASTDGADFTPADAASSTATPSTAEAANMPTPYSRIRQPAVAGSWYSNDPRELAPEIDGYIASSKGKNGAKVPLALVSPHAGYRYSGATAGKVYAEVKGANIRRVWVLAPCHHVALHGAGLFPVDAFRTPLGDLPVDVSVVEELAKKPGFSWLDRGDGGEHALEIQLPFLIRAIGSFELVPIQVGEISADQARQIADAIRPELGPGDLVVISSDFTHYGPRFGYIPFTSDLKGNLDKLDHGAWDRIARADTDGLAKYFDETGATICGRNPLVVLTALLPSGAKGTEVAYASSGELTGDWGNSVSYLGGRLDGSAWSGRGPRAGNAHLVAKATADALLDLAKKSLKEWFSTGKMIQVDPATLPADASTQLGAFVTLEENGDLRGCIGEITPQRPVWEAVIGRAVDAAIHDPRFPPVTADELPALHVDISLLGPSYKAAGPDSIILGRHGIVMSLGYRKATFLPQVAPEQGWDRQETVLHLAMKAGIPASSIPQASYEVYEAQVVGMPE
jgi:MEMO1 family protein